MKNPKILLLGIITLGVALRLQGLYWGLPTSNHPGYSYHPDEMLMILWAQWLAEGYIIPKQFIYGGTLYYSVLNGYLQMALPFHGTLTGAGILADTLLIGRCCQLLLAALSIWLLYQCGTLWRNTAVGLVAALGLALTPAHVFATQHVRPEILSVLLIILLFYLALKILAVKSTKSTLEGRRWFFYAAMTGGAALALRFPLVIFAIMPILARFIDLQSTQNIKAIKTFGIELSIGSVIGSLTYLLLSPHTLLYFADFMAGLQVTLHYESAPFLDAIGHGPLLLQHLTIAMPQAFSPGFCLLAVAGIAYASKQRSQADWVILTGLLINLPLLAAATWVVARYTLPLAPLLLLLIARFVIDITPHWLRLTAYIATGAAMLWSLLAITAFNHLLAGEDVRDQVAKILDKTVLPSQGVLMVQSYLGDEYFLPPPTGHYQRYVFTLQSDQNNQAAERAFQVGGFEYIILPEPLYRNLDRLGTRYPAGPAYDFYQALQRQGFVVWQEIKPKVVFWGMDFSQHYTILDYLVAFPGLRIYTRKSMDSPHANPSNP